MGQWNNNWQSIIFFGIIYRKWFFRLRHITPRHRCQLSIIWFVPKYLHQTLVNFSASPAGDWQTVSLWWAVVESWFLVALKLNFALKNYSMEFLLCPITGRMNVLYESRVKMDMTPLQVSCWRGKFLRWTQSGIPSTIIYTRCSSRRYELGCDAPVDWMLADHMDGLMSSSF